MALNALLCVGEPAVSTDFLDLYDVTKHFIEQDGLAFIDPPTDDDLGAVVLTLRVMGASADAAVDNWRNIYAKLTQARRGSGKRPLGPHVTLGLQLNTTTMLTYDVVDGSLSRPIKWESSGKALQVTLRLDCLPYLRTAPVTVTFTTQTNGGAALSVPNVPGDVDAIAQYTFVDVSTSTAIIQGFRVGRKSHPTFVAGDYTPVIDSTASGSGSSVTTAGAVGGAVAHATLTPGVDFVTVARAPQPASGNGNTGPFDVWGRVQDNAVAMGQPTVLSASVLGQGSFRIVQSAQSLAAITQASTDTPATWGTPTTDGNMLLMFVSWRNGNATIALPGVPAEWGSLPLLGIPAPANQDEGLSVYMIENAGVRSGAENVTWSATALYRQVTLIEIDGVVSDNGLHTYTTTSRTGAVNQLDFFTTVVADGSTPGIPMVADAELMIYAFASAAAATNYVTAWNQATEIADRNGLGIGYRIAHKALAQTSTSVLPGVTATLAASAEDKSHLGLAFLPDTTDLGYRLLAATYQAQIVAVDASGNRSNASGVTTTVVSASNSAIVYSWTAPAGTISYYELHVNDGTGWVYVTTPDATTGYTLTTLDGATAEASAPPTTGALPSPSRLRLVPTLGSGLRPQDNSPAVTAGYSGAFRPVYFGTFDLPPQGRFDAGTLYVWAELIQAMNGGGPSGTVDVDAVWHFPNDEPQALLEWRVTASTLALTVKRKWVYEVSRDLRTAAVLLDASTSAEVGVPERVGRLTLAPGNNFLTVMALTRDLNGYTLDMTNAKYTLSVVYTPRWIWQKGLN